jgi:hypothetical protein
VNIADDIDAFMPKGKMHPSLRGKAQPFQVGDKIEGLFVMDVVPDNHSLILGMEGFDQGGGGNKPERSERPERGDRGERGERRPRQQQQEQVVIPEQKQEVSLADLLSDDEKRKLFSSEN